MKTNLKQIALTIRSVDPKATAAIFAVAYVAGLVGSVAILLVAIAFLAGLYLSTRIVSVPALPQTSQPAIAATAAVPSSAALPNADAISAFGLPVSEIKFKNPAPVRAAKQQP